MQPLPAPGAVAIIFIGAKAAIATFFSVLRMASVLVEIKAVGVNMRDPTAGYCFAQIAVNFTYSAAAWHSHKISPVPFEYRNKEKTQTSVCHVNFQLSACSTTFTNRRLKKIQYFLTIGYTHNKKHFIIPFKVTLEIEISAALLTFTRCRVRCGCALMYIWVGKRNSGVP